MMIKGLLLAGAVALVSVLLFNRQPGVDENRIEIVVERTENYVELYLSAPAPALSRLFGLQARGLAEPDGTVDFERLRLGTMDLGDELFETVTSKVGGVETDFEAMSLMAHPIEQRLPLNNALDGAVAVSVCTTVPTATPLRLAQLQAYAGFIAVTRHPTEPVSLRFPNLERETWTVSVRDHLNGKLRRAYTTSMTGDGELLLQSEDSSPLLKDRL